MKPLQPKRYNPVLASLASYGPWVLLFVGGWLAAGGMS